MSFLGNLFNDSFNGRLADPSGNFSDGIGGLFDPAGTNLNSMGNSSPVYDNVTAPATNFANNVGDFGLDQIYKLGDDFSHDPSQLFTGIDPFSTWGWNKILSRNDKPWVTQLGGPTKDTYQYSANRGHNPEDASYGAAVANMIAGAEAGSWAGGVAGGAAEVGTEASAGSSALSDAAGETAGGGYGSSATAADASSIPGWSAGGGGAYGTAVRQGASGATRGAINALDNNKNAFNGAWEGAGEGIVSGLGNLDYAGTAGVEDPLYKNVINNTINGGVKSGMQDTSKTGYGALSGLFSSLAGQGGNALNNYLSSPSYGSQGTGQQAGGTNFENLAAGLGNLWLAHRNGQGIQGQINNLNSLYAPNSPYAQQMQQALNRQDAAGGRRSQYGTRQVELQAALANAASRNAPTLSTLYGQQRQNNFGQLAGLFTTGRNAGLYNGLGQNQQQPGFNGNQSSGYTNQQPWTVGPQQPSYQYQQPTDDYSGPA